MRTTVPLLVVVLAGAASTPAYGDDAADVLLDRVKPTRYARSPAQPVEVRLAVGGPVIGNATLYMPEVVGEEAGQLRVRNYTGDVELLLYVDPALLLRVVVERTTIAAGKDGVGATLPAGSPVTLVQSTRARYEDRDVWIEGAIDPTKVGAAYTSEMLIRHYKADALLVDGADFLDAPKGKIFAHLKVGGSAWPHHMRKDGYADVQRLRSSRGHELVRYETDAGAIVGWVAKRSVSPWTAEEEDEEDGVEGGIEGGVGGGVRGGCYPSNEPALAHDTLLYLTPGGPIVGATNGPVCSDEGRGEARDGFTAWTFATAWGKVTLWTEGAVPAPVDDGGDAPRQPPEPDPRIRRDQLDHLPIPTQIDKNQLVFPDVYRTLGRDDLAIAYERRSSKKRRLGEAGLLVAASSLNCLWYCPLLDRDVAIGVTAGLIGVGGLLYMWGARIDPEPIGRGELDQMIDARNRGLIPYLTPDGAGLTAVGTF